MIGLIIERAVVADLTRFNNTVAAIGDMAVTVGIAMAISIIERPFIAGFVGVNDAITTARQCAIVAAAIIVIVITVVTLFVGLIDDSVAASRLRNKTAAIFFAGASDLIIICGAAVANFNACLNDAVTAFSRLAIDTTVVGIGVCVVAFFVWIDMSIAAVGDRDDMACCFIANLMTMNTRRAVALFTDSSIVG